MSSTMLQIVQQITGELNLSVPSFVQGNQSQDVQQVLALTNAAGKELTKEYDWQALEKEFRFYTNYVNTTGSCLQGSYVISGIPSTVGLSNKFTVTGSSFPQDTEIVSVDSLTQVTVNQKCSATQIDQSVLFSQTIYPLPVDYETITDSTQWDKSKHWQMIGPMDAQQWQWLKSGYISTGPRIRWRILGKQFQTWPPMNTSEYLGFEYRSNGWAESATGTPQQSFIADSDTTLLDDRLLVLYSKLKYFQVKSFDTTALYQDYQRYLSVVKANDKGSANLSFAPQPSKVLIGYANIPDTGYGS
ncbi:hypothetical protein UFOVP20_44 [uncultured Caudovirales phage]|uniref:Uncharacterized protein n=1 Tax=uncultured Caudovirales phage TaxID=2100421 RepID=A0A6J5KPG4_9CAUD|nr:hypothetical protein UFOVP20_44 [uncultured Caudovirales phage]